MRLKNIFSRFDLFYIIAYISLFAIWVSAWRMFEYEYLYLYLTSSIYIYIFFINHYAINPKFAIISQKTLVIKEINLLYLLCFVSIASTILYLILAGVPLLSTNPALSKLQVSQYPFLVRFYRITGLLPIFMIMASNDIKYKEIIKKYSLIMVFLGFLTAFKGYAVPYIASYLLLRFSGINIYFIFKIILATMIAMLYLSIAGGVDFVEVLEFLLERITELQILGTNVLADNYLNIIYYPIISEFTLPIMKIVSPEILSLQQNLYQIYHVYDENKLELANFYNAELIFYYGFAWSLFFMLALMIVIIVVVKRFVRSRFAFAAVVLLNMSIIDGLMNGKLVFRILDCSFFIFISYLIVIVLSKLRFKIL